MKELLPKAEKCQGENAYHYSYNYRGDILTLQDSKSITLVIIPTIQMDSSHLRHRPIQMKQLSRTTFWAESMKSPPPEADRQKWQLKVTATPDVPHVGYRTGEKKKKDGKKVGHIFVDEVPAGRSRE